MRNRVPVAKEERAPVPEFDPVPRKYRHDGWTPERQRAFISALADTGSVTRAAAMVNMAQANCYTLRRAPGAEGFRRAWEAALDFGVARLKDIAFERAMEGYLVPVFIAGKLAGYRRRHNDALLMFCLRHYGQDANGRRTTINYFSTRASAGAGGGAADGGGGAAAEASTTTVRTVISGAGGDGALTGDESAATLADFGGVALDAQAHGEIQAALLALAERARADDQLHPHSADAMFAALDDGPERFVRVVDGMPLIGLTDGGLVVEPAEGQSDALRSEAHWSQAGAAIDPMWHEVIDARAAEGLPTAAE